MGMVVKISGKSNPESVRKALEKLAEARSKKKHKTLADFYGALPNTYEDGLAYQKKVRNEWE